MPWDNASFSGRPDTEAVDKNKVQEESRGAHFPTSWAKKNLGIFFSLCPVSRGCSSLLDGSCVSCIASPGLIPIDLEKPGTCHAPWQMERAGMWHQSRDQVLLQTFLFHDLAQTVLLLWFLNVEREEGTASFQIFHKPLWK